MRLVSRTSLAHIAPMMLAATFAAGCMSADDTAPFEGDDPSAESPAEAPRPLKLRRDGRLLESDEASVISLAEVRIAPEDLDGISGPQGVVPSNDTCLGATSVTLDMDLGTPALNTQAVVGTTVGAIDDYRSFCGDTSITADSPDVAYKLVLSQPGVLDLSIVGTGFAPILHIDRAVCGQAQAQDHCLSLSSTQHFKQWFEAGTYSIIVDGNGSTTGGAFTLTAKVSANACGDAVLAPTEACDDGNMTNGDGCNSLCAFEGATGTNDECSGDAVAITTAAIQRRSGFTTGYTDNYQGSCVYEGGAPDRVWRVTPATSGTLVVSVGKDANSNEYCADENNRQCWDRALYVRSAGHCSSLSSVAGSELACSDGLDWSDTEQVTVPVIGGQDYFVILDGYGDFAWSAGHYELMMELRP